MLAPRSQTGNLTGQLGGVRQAAAVLSANAAVAAIGPVTRCLELPNAA